MNALVNGSGHFRDDGKIMWTHAPSLSYFLECTPKMLVFLCPFLVIHHLVMFLLISVFHVQILFFIHTV